MRKLILKGSAPVDSECTKKLGVAHVYTEGEDVYDALLNQARFFISSDFFKSWFRIFSFAFIVHILHFYSIIVNSGVTNEIMNDEIFFKINLFTWFQTNIKKNSNKYYILQLLEDDNAKIYSVWFRWGRVGYKVKSKFLFHLLNIYLSQWICTYFLDFFYGIRRLNFFIFEGPKYAWMLWYQFGSRQETILPEVFWQDVGRMESSPFIC